MKMKTLVFSTAMLLGFSSYTLAMPMTFTIENEEINVGYADEEEARSNFADWDYNGNGNGNGNGASESAETAWVNDELGTSFESTSYEVHKTETVLATKVDQDDAYAAFKFDVAPAYFLIKDGAGEDGSTHWLFKNLDSLDWGVVNLEQLFGNSWDSVSYEISHVTRFGVGVSVPEPGTLAIIFTGITGLIAARRRVKKAA